MDPARWVRGAPGSDIDLTLRGPVKWVNLQKIETELDSLDLPYKIDAGRRAVAERNTIVIPESHSDIRNPGIFRTPAQRQNEQ